jgi:hypothetical protein
MKNKLYTTIFVLILGVIISGCSEDFLEKKPIAIQTAETFYSDFDAVDATCTAAYGELNAREVFDKDYYLVLGSIPSDDVECGGETINDYPTAQHVDQFLHTLSDEVPMDEIWAYCYKGLRHANTAINRLENITEIDEEADPAIVSQRIGEMKFLRGLYHFFLVQIFGGVPIADKEISPSEFETPRSDIKTVFSYIEGELKDAIPLLQERSQLDASNIGRATKGAARSLLLKVLVYESSYAENYPGDERFGDCQNRWAEAFQYGLDVFDPGNPGASQYSLVGINGERYTSWRTGTDTSATIDGFRWIFTADGDNSAGSIFEIQSIFDQLGYGVTHGNVVTVYQTVRQYVDAGGVIQNSYGGWSFNCPTDALIAGFRNDDPRESGLNSSPIASETLDPRYATTVGTNSDSILFGPNYQWVMMNCDNLPTGRIGRKFECGYDEYWFYSNDPWSGPMNVRLIRLADVMLLTAEAAYKTGDNATALELVNLVRERARMCGTTNEPAALPAISYEDIIHERRLELALEPHRFFDLVRWGLADEFIHGEPILALGPDFTIDWIPGKHEFFPLPISEVEVSNGALVQYGPWQ